MRRPDHLFSFFSARGAALALALHASRAVRSPAAYARASLRALRGPDGSFVRFLRFPVDAAAVAASPLFDARWFSARAAASGRPAPRDPALEYMLSPWRGAPDGGAASPRFSCAEYVAQNPEIADCGVHPLVHYEQYGRFTGLRISAADAAAADRTPVFPPGAADVAETFSADFPVRRRRVALFAAYSPDGRVPPADLLYAAALREVCDAVVFAANSPLLPEEAGKLRGVAACAVCRHHGGYDFGSWRLALAAARAAGWLAPERCDELVFANDSCLAPAAPLSGMFDAMARRKCDAWGVTENAQLTAEPHLQSYFLVFRRPVLDSAALDDFFAARPERVSRAEAVRLFEMQLTEFLHSRGFSTAAFAKIRASRRFPANPTTRPARLLRRGVPMVKAKVFRGESCDPPERILALLRRKNPALASLVRIEPPRDPVP